MKGRLVAFLVLFPACLWVLEWVLRWALKADDSQTFLAPAISSAALGMIGPVAVHRDGGNSFGDRRDANVSFVGLLFLLPAVIGWSFCIAVNIRKEVPDALGIWMSQEAWQFAVAMVMYSIAMLLTLFKEGA